MGKCIRCLDGELVQRPTYGEDYDLYKCYDCPECGAIHEVYLLDKSERHLYPKYNPEEEAMFVDSSHGYDGFCPECGSHIIWSVDFMRSDILDDVDNSPEMLNEYGFSNDDSLVTEVFCPYCGASITVIDAKPSEQKNYPYFNEKNNE